MRPRACVPCATPTSPFVADFLRSRVSYQDCSSEERDGFSANSLFRMGTLASLFLETKTDSLMFFLFPLFKTERQTD